MKFGPGVKFLLHGLHNRWPVCLNLGWCQVVVVTLYHFGTCLVDPNLVTQDILLILNRDETEQVANIIVNDDLELISIINPITT